MYCRGRRQFLLNVALHELAMSLWFVDKKGKQCKTCAQFMALFLFGVCNYAASAGANGFLLCLRLFLEANQCCAGSISKL